MGAMRGNVSGTLLRNRFAYDAALSSGSGSMGSSIGSRSDLERFLLTLVTLLWRFALYWAYVSLRALVIHSPSRAPLEDATLKKRTGTTGDGVG